jgi:hypothetical protein
MTKLTNHDLVSAIDCFDGMFCRIIRTGRSIYVFDTDKENGELAFVARDASGINGKGNGTYTTHYANELKSI